MQKEFDTVFVEVFRTNRARKDYSKQTGLWFSYCDISEIYQKHKEEVIQILDDIFLNEDIKRVNSTIYLPTLGPDMESTKCHEYFSLKTALYAGFRIDSIQSRKFRAWAIDILFSHIVKGYSINNNIIDVSRLEELKNTICNLNSKFKINPNLVDNNRILGAIYNSYLKCFNLIQAFSDENIILSPTLTIAEEVITYNIAKSLISSLKSLLKEKSNFGGERKDTDYNKSFHNILTHIMHSFGEEEPLNFVQYKAANLLYDIIKEKPFVSGNKRIACMLFLYYLKISNINFIHLSPSVLSLLALFIANSNISSKDLIIRLIISLIC